jgi:hypothetical protein
MRTLALLLAFAALPAFAQESKETKPAPQKEERRPLNLKLDNPGSWATVAPETEKTPGGALPSLGDDARAMPAQVPRSDSGSVYPKDTQPGGR